MLQVSSHFLVIGFKNLFVAQVTHVLLSLQFRQLVIALQTHLPFDNVLKVSKHCKHNPVITSHF